MSTILFQRSNAYDLLISLSSGVVSRSEAKALAVELFHFLTVKRSLALSSLNEVVKVSPGPLMDQLWHRMLMETEVRVWIFTFLFCSSLVFV